MDSRKKAHEEQGYEGGVIDLADAVEAKLRAQRRARLALTKRRSSGVMLAVRHAESPPARVSSIPPSG